MFDIQQWETIAEYILPVLLGEGIRGETRHYWTLVEMGIRAEHFPPGIMRETYRAAGEIISTDAPAHISSIDSALNGVGDKHKLALWVAAYKQPSTLAGDTFQHNAGMLRRLGEQARLIQIATELTTAFRQTDDLDATLNSAMTSLALSGSETIAGETLDALIADIETEQHYQPDNLHTGLKLLDTWLGGIPRGHFMAIAAPMKQRKTTLLLNMILHMIRAGLSVTLLMFENRRALIGYQLIAMVATEYAIAHNWHTREDGELLEFSASDLKAMGDGYRAMGARYERAVDEAKAHLRGLKSNLRIYDRTPKGGGLSDLDSVRRRVLHDKVVHGVDFVALDHAQRVTVPRARGDYERMNVIAPELEAFTREHGLTFCLLAQMAAGYADGSESYRSGTRGGTQLDEAVDALLGVGYRVKDKSNHLAPDSELQVTMLHNRYGSGGRHKTAIVDIDPASGLILKNGAYRKPEAQS